MRKSLGTQLLLIPEDWMFYQSQRDAKDLEGSWSCWCAVFAGKLENLISAKDDSSKDSSNLATGHQQAGKQECKAFPSIFLLSRPPIGTPPMLWWIFPFKLLGLRKALIGVPKSLLSWVILGSIKLTVSTTIVHQKFTICFHYINCGYLKKKSKGELNWFYRSRHVFLPGDHVLNPTRKWLSHNICVTVTPYDAMQSLL